MLGRYIGRRAPQVEVEADGADDAADGGARVHADAYGDVDAVLALAQLHLVEHREAHADDPPRRLRGGGRLVKGAAAHHVSVADGLDLVHAVPLGEAVKQTSPRGGRSRRRRIAHSRAL